jgi:hypothetical protein
MIYRGVRNPKERAFFVRKSDTKGMDKKTKKKKKERSTIQNNKTEGEEGSAAYRALCGAFVSFLSLTFLLLAGMFIEFHLHQVGRSVGFLCG